MSSEQSTGVRDRPRWRLWRYYADLPWKLETPSSRPVPGAQPEPEVIEVMPVAEHEAAMAAMREQFNREWNDAMNQALSIGRPK